jgi:hypothetical protein
VLLMMEEAGREVFGRATKPETTEMPTGSLTMEELSLRSVGH